MFQIFYISTLYKNLETSKHYIFIGQRSKMQTTITNKILPQILKGFETFFIHIGTFAKNIYFMVKGFDPFQNVSHLFCLKSL